MTPAKDSFEEILEEFKSHLTPKECHDFQFTTLADVKEAALRIQRDQEQLKNMMNMRRLESWFEAMEQFGRVIEVFANANVFVAFVWGPMKFILQTASTWADTFEAILDAYSQIGEHMPLLEQYKSLFGTKPHMQRVLALIYNDILQFHKKAVKRMFKGRGEVWRQLFRSLWKDFGTRFKGLLDNLNAHRRLIVEQAELLHFEDSQRDREILSAYIRQHEQDRAEKVERLREKKREEKNKKYLAILEWFSASKSTNQNHEDFQQTRMAYPGSGEWILHHEQVKNWREMDPPTSSILWLNGKIGAGKTILASIIVDKCLQDRSSATAYFYCQEDNPEKNDCISIYRGLLSQLLGHCRTVLPYCHEKLLDSGEVNLNSQKLAQQLLKLLFEKIPKLFIVIDGLDECNLAQRQSVLEFLSLMVKTVDDRDPGKLRVLIVCQELPDIGKALPTAEVAKLTEKDDRRDIQRYVQDWSLRIVQKYPPVTADQIDFIKESTLLRSQGMFLFAKLVMENLHAQETFMNLKDEIEKYPFPDGLGQAYDRILRRLKLSLHSKRWEVGRKLLGWMVCAKRPLKWQEIQAAVSIDAENETIDFESGILRSSVEEYCGSLVQVLSGDRVELIHTTAKIHITESEYIKPLTVECDLATLCLRYLTFEVFDSEIELESLEFETANGLLAFQDYAAAKWHEHLRALLTRSPIETTTGDTESQAALHLLGCGLDIFSSRYEQEIQEGQIHDQALEACETFRTYPFHTSLVQIWNHVYRHDRKGSEAKKEISIKSLHEAVKRNREVIETIATAKSSNLAAINFFYGEKHFKCERPTCFYFHEGFKDLASRKKHINRHDRPFHCSFPDCSIAEFGFSSGKELEKHMKLFHPETVDQSNVFDQTSRASAQTRWHCELCGKNFTRGFHLRSHLTSHAGEKPFKCCDCGRGFARKNDCKRHEKLHTR